MTYGVIYMAWGENAIKQAHDSIWSLREFEKDIDIRVVGPKATRLYFDAHEIKTLVVNKDPFNHHGPKGFKFMAGRIKPLLAELSPWDQTLYVDADTRFIRSPQEGFDLLDKYDVALAETENRDLIGGSTHYTECQDTQKLLGVGRILYHNSGMIFWRRNEKTTHLFDLWSEEWLKYKNWDEQVALLRALMRSEVKFLTLPYTWNCYHKKQAYLLHHWFGSADARIEMKRKRTRSKTPQKARKLVRLEIAPGRIVKCHEGDEEKVLEQYRKRGLAK